MDTDRRTVGRLHRRRRAPERVRHGLAEMIRYRAVLITAGYPDGNDRDALKSDPAFKTAIGRLPESGADLCSQPSISRLENLPGTGGTSSHDHRIIPKISTDSNPTAESFRYAPLPIFGGEAGMLTISHFIPPFMVR
jgi:DDE family transposase